MERERRRFKRIESMLSVRYSSKKGGYSGYSFTRDLSEGGLNLPLTAAVPRGGLLDLFISLPSNGLREIHATAKLRWIKKNLEHWKPRYNAGFRFLEINLADIIRLLDYAKNHKWIKNGFERELEEDKIPVLGEKGDFGI